MALLITGCVSTPHYQPTTRLGPTVTMSILDIRQEKAEPDEPRTCFLSIRVGIENTTALDLRITEKAIWDVIYCCRLMANEGTVWTLRLPDIESAPGDRLDATNWSVLVKRGATVKSKVRTLALSPPLGVVNEHLVRPEARPAVPRQLEYTCYTDIAVWDVRRRRAVIVGASAMGVVATPIN